MIPSLVEVELFFRRTHSGDILHCTVTRLRGITTHYTEIFIVIITLKKHLYIMLPWFAIFFSLFTLMTGFIVYIIGIIPALSLRAPVKMI